MLARMDLAVGRVLDALKRTGADANTLIFYFSDNGGARRNCSNNGILRDYKHSVYEGGLRVPFIVSWPGKLPGGKVCTEPVICLDIMPTVCAAAGIKLPGNRVYDGKNMLPLINGTNKAPLHEALFWDGAAGKWAVRVGQWKLLKEKGDPELYDLQADVGEKENLAADNPETVDRLQKTYLKWKSEMAPRIKKVKRSKAKSKAGKQRPKRRAK